MTDKYDALAQRLREDHVHETHRELGLINPFSYPDLKERWNRDFAGRLEALNDKSKLRSKRLLVFFDYWPLNLLKKDQLRMEQGKQCATTPWERIKPALSRETGVDEWLWHNFVCFIKDTERSDTAVSKEALNYCLPYFLGLIDAQETKLIGITNFTVLNILMEHYKLPKFSTMGEAVFSDELIVLPNQFKTKVIALYHPGSNGQLNCERAYKKRGVIPKVSRDALLISDWRKRLAKYS